MNGSYSWQDPLLRAAAFKLRASLAAVVTESDLSLLVAECEPGRAGILKADARRRSQGPWVDTQPKVLLCVRE